MNIAFLTTTLPRFPGDGQSPFVFEQARAWKVARPTDTVHIIAPGDYVAAQEETLEGIHIHRYTYFWPRQLQKLAYPALLPNIRRSPLLVLQLPFLLLSAICYLLFNKNVQNIDLLYAHWVVPNGLVAWIVNKIPYVVQNHSSDLRILVKIPLIGKPLARAIIRNASVFFCVNSQLKKEALDLFERQEKEAIESKIVVLPMGANVQMGKQKTKNIYDFGFIGRLSKKKGVDKFIEALKLMNLNGKKVTVGIAGVGEEEENLKFEIRNLKKTNTQIRITLLGQIVGHQKEQFFQQTKVLVFPSLPINGDIEGIPVSVLEALIYGKQIIASRATNIEQLPEWDSIKKFVTLVDDVVDAKQFAALLESVLKSSDWESKADSRAQQAIMQRYAWSRLIQEYIQKLT